MCANGVNTQQLQDTVKHIDETIALARRWTHQMYHLADNGKMERSAAQLQKVQVALDDVRALLDEAHDAIERDDRDTGVTVTAV